MSGGVSYPMNMLEKIMDMLKDVPHAEGDDDIFCHNPFCVFHLGCPSGTHSFTDGQGRTVERDLLTFRVIEKGVSKWVHMALCEECWNLANMNCEKTHH